MSSLQATRSRVLAQVERAESVQDIVYMAQKRIIPRDEILPDGTQYSVHGIGCRMTDPEGAEVDVDIDDEGLEVFDAWRVYMHLESVSPSNPVSREEISMACQRLVELGELREVRANWFQVAVRSYNPR
ncbi:DUF6896 domain-containing protein [Thermobifida halotolerans]|uniref:DUF6896 domain-containing protein n=1 Tax=Thermobifida halotolerans TaxID=483545 RepID=UPI0012F5069F|nr:hypothetical protein [Thermobifida halotolerans]